MNVIQLNLVQRRGERITMLFYDGIGNRLLKRTDIVYDPLKHANLRLFIGEYRDMGISHVRIDILEKKSRKRISKFYEIR